MLGPFLHYRCGLVVERHRRLRRPGGHYERQISGLGMGQRTARCHQIPVSPLQYIAAGPRFSLGSNEGSCSRIFPNFQTNLEKEAGIPCGNIGFLTLLGVPQLPPPLSSAHVPHEPGYPCSSRQSSSSKYSTHSTPLPLHSESTGIVQEGSKLFHLPERFCEYKIFLVFEYKIFQVCESFARTASKQPLYKISLTSLLEIVWY